MKSVNYILESGFIVNVVIPFSTKTGEDIEDVMSKEHPSPSCSKWNINKASCEVKDEIC
jgi:hypothetical protein